MSKLQALPLKHCSPGPEKRFQKVPQISARMRHKYHFSTPCGLYRTNMARGKKLSSEFYLPFKCLQFFFLPWILKKMSKVFFRILTTESINVAKDWMAFWCARQIKLCSKFHVWILFLVGIGFCSSKLELERKIVNILSIQFFPLNFFFLPTSIFPSFFLSVCVCFLICKYKRAYLLSCVSKGSQCFKNVTKWEFLFEVCMSQGSWILEF